MTMRCVVDAGFSLRAGERNRLSWVRSIGLGIRGRSVVFIAGVSQGWKPGVYRASELMEGKRLMRPLPQGLASTGSCSSGLAFSARSSLRIEFTRISQMVFFWAGFLPTFLVSYSRLRSSPSTCR